MAGTRILRGNEMNQAAEQFHQRAAAFVRANPGMVFVVRGDQHKDAVRDWFTYFHTRGQLGTISLFRQILNGNGVVQFPCERPEHFDPSYIAPVHSWREPQGRGVSRGDVRHVVESTLDSLRKAKPRGRQPVPKSHLAEPVKTPKEWLDEYSANSPPIPVFSDEFREKFGLRKDKRPPTSEAAA
jgi:hypothetical protein